MYHYSLDWKSIEHMLLYHKQEYHVIPYHHPMPLARLLSMVSQEDLNVCILTPTSAKRLFLTYFRLRDALSVKCLTFKQKAHDSLMSHFDHLRTNSFSR